MSSCVSFLTPVLYAFFIHLINATSPVRFILLIFGGVKLTKLLIIHFHPTLYNSIYHHHHHHQISPPPFSSSAASTTASN
jgi:hypothetical protein